MHYVKLQRYSDLLYDSSTLAKSILLLPHNFTLDKKEGEQGSYHVIKGPNFGDDIVIL